MCRDLLFPNCGSLPNLAFGNSNGCCCCYENVNALALFSHTITTHTKHMHTHTQSTHSTSTIQKKTRAMRRKKIKWNGSKNKQTKNTTFLNISWLTPANDNSYSTIRKKYKKRKQQILSVKPSLWLPICDIIQICTATTIPAPTLMLHIHTYRMRHSACPLPNKKHSLTQ